MLPTEEDEAERKDEASELTIVTPQRRALPAFQGIKFMPSGLLPSDIVIIHLVSLLLLFIINYYLIINFIKSIEITDFVIAVHAVSLLVVCHVTPSKQQGCPVSIADADRRDCHPWPFVTQSSCEARGCVWCSSPTPGVPYCFYNDKVCPSQVAEANRVDCLPEGGFRTECLQKRCTYCETTTPGAFKTFDVNKSNPVQLCDRV